MVKHHTTRKKETKDQIDYLALRIKELEIETTKLKEHLKIEKKFLDDLNNIKQ